MTTSRRQFLQSISLAAAAVTTSGLWNRAAWGASAVPSGMLSEFGYGDVLMASDLHESQLMTTHAVLMALSEDSLLKPLRQMSGMPAPGEDLGGWYHYDPDYDYRNHFDAASLRHAPSGNGFRRSLAPMPSPATRRRARRCSASIACTPRPSAADFYIKNRFPAYTYDKLLLGLLDSHTYVKDPQALAILEQTTNTALPHLPGHAVEHDVAWRTDKDKDDASWTWDESYTIPENLFLAYQRGAGRATTTSACSTSTTRPGSIPSRATRTCSPAGTRTAM